MIVDNALRLELVPITVCAYSSIRRVLDRLLLDRVRGRSADHLITLFDPEGTPHEAR